MAITLQHNDARNLGGEMGNKLALIALLVATNAFADSDPLTMDRGLYGNSRHCLYSSGRMLIVPVEASCPATAPPRQDSGKGIGFLKGMRAEGSSKVCVYLVGSVSKDLRIESNGNCPTNYHFE
jgi:hypothetical protein